MYSGSLVLLYLKSDERWNIVGGMRTTKFTLNNQLIDASICSDSPWKELHKESGLKQLIITISGAFSNSRAENDIQKYAFQGKIAEYRLVYPAGNSLSGNFQISNYHRVANVDEEESYSLSLVSSGQVFFLG